MKYKAAIFDLDGTLLDTIDDLADSCNIALEREGFPTHPVTEYKNFVGMGMRHLVKTALPKEASTDEGIESFLENLNSEYLKRLVLKTKPFPGVISLLTELKAREVKMSILSNKPHFMVLPAVEHFFREFPFTVIMGIQEKFSHKPNPESTLSIITQMGESPDRTVFIGDSEVDIRTARNAGIDVIGVGWGFRTIEMLRSEGAATIVEKPEELLEFF